MGFKFGNKPLPGHFNFLSQTGGLMLSELIGQKGLRAG